MNSKGSWVDRYYLDDGSVRWRGRPVHPVTRERMPSKSFIREREAWDYVRAEVARAARECGVEPGETVARPRAGRITFRAFADHWLATYNVGEMNTRKTAAAHARKLIEEFGDVLVDEIHESAIVAYLGRLEVDGQSASTRASRLSTLRLILNRAVDENRRPDNPCRNIKAPKQARAKRLESRTLDADEIDRAMLCLPPWLAPALLVSLDSGLRVGEVCGLRWEAVSLDMRMVKVATVVLQDGTVREYPKGKEVLRVPLSHRAVAALDELRNRTKPKPTDYVFTEPKNHGRPTNPHRVKNVWKAAQRKAWIDSPIRWHDLRHACAHALVNGRNDMPTIQRIMRHADLSTTQNYMPTVSMKAMHDAIDKAAG